MSFTENDLKTGLNEKAVDNFIRSIEGCGSKMLRVYRATINRFIKFVQCIAETSSKFLVDESKLLEWMVRESAGITPHHADMKFAVVNRFLSSLRRVGLITANPMAEFKAHFGKQGWVKIARALGSANREEALEALKVEPRFCSVLGKHICNYLALKRSLGTKCHTEEGTLANFDRFLRKESIKLPQEVTREFVNRWLATMTCGPITLMYKIRWVWRLFNHLLAMRIIAQNPVDIVLISNRPRRTPFQPYIYSKEEVLAIFREARRLPSYRKFPLRPQTLETIFTIFYALGLRLSEACRLQIKDVNLDQNLLYIRKTKFHKSRIVPYGPHIGIRIERYLEVRQTLCLPLRTDDPLFIAGKRRHIGTRTVHSAFRRVVDAAGITVPQGRNKPRLHDLRHTFAVNRLLRWYRDGVDVQSKLPLLSTFMGHVDIHSTQVYLSITTELLEEANKRFFKRFGCLLDEEVQNDN